MYLPFVVGKRIDYLLRNGRRVEALALVNIDFDQEDLRQRFFDNLMSESAFAAQIDKMNMAYGSLSAALGEKFMPIFTGLIQELQEVL